jgi:thiol-disulfide isomerase/thioredoxin
LSKQILYRLGAAILTLCAVGIVVQVGLPTAPDFSVVMRDGDSQNVVPGFEVASLNGSSLHISPEMGHPLILNFWATWCVPCEAEMPMLQSVYDVGIPVVAIHEGGSRNAENPAQVLDWVEQHKLSFPVVIDSENRSLEAQFRIKGWPTTFFIDVQGVIRQVIHGALTEENLTKGLAMLQQGQ